MSNKFNNKTLLLILAVLVVLFVFFQFYHKARTEKTIKTDLVVVDTARVSKILLYPMSEKHAEILFQKEGSIWKVSMGKISCNADVNAMQGLLGQLMNIKTQRLASKSKAKWSEYQLSDTTGTRIKVYEGKKLVTDLILGKFTYQQSRNQYSMYGGGGVSGTTYVRLAGEEEIYAIDGFVVFSFNQEFKNWRNQLLIRLNKQEVTRLSFKYPGDSSFTAEMHDKKWYSGANLLDSVKITEYLGSLAFKNVSSFDDTFIPVSSSTCQLIIEGSNNMKPINIQAYIKIPGEYIINSNLNDKSFFTCNNTNLFSEIFKTEKDFLSVAKGTKKKRKK